MIIPAPEPAPNPEDADSQLLLGPPPEDFLLSEHHRNAVISQAEVIQTARHIAAYRGEDNPRILRSSLMAFEEALKVGPNDCSLSEQDLLNNVIVWLVEMSGTFQRRSSRPPIPGRTTAPRLPATKAYIILRAADGLELGYALSRG